METNKHKNIDSEEFLMGEELLSEAAAALFEEPARIACDISADEAQEFEALRNLLSSDTYSNAEEGTLSLAAEDETPYGTNE